MIVISISVLDLEQIEKITDFKYFIFIFLSKCKNITNNTNN